ncbi:MAG: T9SS type A sorting domain-containing protein [Bacteroidota bacterium]
MKSYLDFNTGWPENSWEITEPAIYYQAAYLRFLAHSVPSSELVNTNELVKVIPISVQPNPANGRIRLQVPAGDYQLRIFSANGQLIRHESIRATDDLDLTQLPSGTYWLELRGAEIYRGAVVRQ